MKIKSAKKFMTRLSPIIMAAALTAAITGCGAKDLTDLTGADAAQTQESAVSDTPVNNSGSADADEDAQSSAMGRYIGTTVLEADDTQDEAFVTKMNDGTLTLYRSNSLVYALLDEYDIDGMYTSDDNGSTWTPVDMKEKYKALAEEDISYIVDSKISSDGTIAVGYALDGDDGLENVQYMLVYSDGSTKKIESKLTADDKWVKYFCFNENGRLFASTLGARVYEINTQDGSMTQVLASDDFINQISCHGDILMITTGDKIALYDMKSKSYIEDTVWDDFIKENIGDLFDSWDRGHVAVSFMDDEAVYVVCSKGLYRHIIGGSAIEQIIDGNSTQLADPSHLITDAVMVDDQEFIVNFTDNRTVKFAYDASVPTVPSDRLTIYSLKENDTVKQAIAAYQTENPDVYVEYKIGMDGDAVTRDDALKNLSTELLSGEGPDVLVLDDMSADTYINQGILSDMSEIVSEIDAADGLFMNLVEPLYVGESLYMVPAEFTLPAAAGDKDVLKSADGIGDIADFIEEIRNIKPEGNLLSIARASGILKKFMHICEPGWTDESGNIDEDGIKNYLEQTKRIYEAQMSGLSQKEIDTYNRWNDSDKEDGEKQEDSKYFHSISVMVSDDGKASFIFGELDSMLSYANLITLPRNSGMENMTLMPISGDEGSIYVPKTMLGINAAAKNSQNAQDFVKTMFSQDVQDSLHNGYPLNRKSFDDIFVVDPKLVADDGGFMYYSSVDEDGNESSRVTYVPTDEQKMLLKGWIERADVPYISDKVLEDAVIAEGEKYLDGEQSVDDAVKAIMDKVMIYVAE